MVALDDLPSLALFARVVHHRSFSAAAREAGIAKSAVSRRIARLEETLGVRLLQRSTRALSVTEEGVRVYEQCVRLLSAAEAAQEAAGSDARVVRGRLRVSAPSTLTEMHLARATALFLREYPDVRVELTTENRLVSMAEEGVDVAVRVGRLADSDYHAKKLAKDRLVLCASPEYLARRGEPSRPEDLLGHDCLHYSLVPIEAEWRFRRRGVPLSLPVNGRFVAGDGAVLREAAIAGAGIVVLPFFMVAPDVAACRLRLVLEGTRRAEIGIFAMMPGGPQRPLRVRAFVDFLVRYFAAVRWDERRATAET